MTQIDFDALVQPTRIHGSLYTSPSVHDAELSRIFHQGWVFLAHDSEVASPGDYVTRTIGGQPLIVARGRDDVVVIDRVGGVRDVLVRPFQARELIGDASVR